MYHFPFPFTIKTYSITTVTSHISYRFNNYSIFYFCPFNSFCFSNRLLRFLQSSFMRSTCARTLSRQSSSTFLYSPVRLRIVLSFSFIYSNKHTQSIRLYTSLSFSQRSVYTKHFSRFLCRYIRFLPMLHIVLSFHYFIIGAHMYSDVIELN